MADIIKHDGQDYINAKDMHKWIRKQAGLSGRLITYKMFLDMVKHTDSIDVKNGV